MRPPQQAPPWWARVPSGLPSPDVRLRAVRMLRDLNHLPWEAAARVEAGLSAACVDDDTLISAAKRVCHNIACDPSICDRFTPGELGCQPDAALRCVALARLEEAQADRERYITGMLQARYDEVHASDAAAALLRCRSCRSTDISWQQRQIRGADESMTVYCTCMQCGSRWKLS